MLLSPRNTVKSGCTTHSFQFIKENKATKWSGSLGERGYSRIWSHGSLKVHGCLLIIIYIFLYRARGIYFHSQGWLTMATFQRNTWRRQQGIHVPELYLVTNGSDAAGREELFRDQNQDTFILYLHTQKDSAAWEVNTLCVYSLLGDWMLRVIT